jgi:hypothetical protein
MSIPRDDVVALQQTSEYRDFLLAFEGLGEVRVGVGPGPTGHFRIFCSIEACYNVLFSTRLMRTLFIRLATTPPPPVLLSISNHDVGNIENDNRHTGGP